MPGDEYVLEYAWELARCSSAVEGAAREGGGGEVVRESGGEEEREDDAEELELRLRVRERFWDAETEETVRVRSDAVDLSAHTDGGGGGGARMAARSTRRRARRGAKRRARRRAKTRARRAATISRTQRGRIPGGAAPAGAAGRCSTCRNGRRFSMRRCGPESCV